MLDNRHGVVTCLMYFVSTTWYHIEEKGGRLSALPFRRNDYNGVVSFILFTIFPPMNDMIEFPTERGDVEIERRETPPLYFHIVRVLKIADIFFPEGVDLDET